MSTNVDRTEHRFDDVGYCGLVVALVAIAVYLLSLQNGFALDDRVVVSGDPRVVASHIGALITRTYWNDSTLALYRPLTSVSFALDWYVSKGSAAWFHFVNVTWHALASFLAFLLLTRFFKPVAAMAGGLIFALHPVHVEAVANVVGRAEIIAAAFFFAACLAWTEENLGVYTRACIAALLSLLAFFAKENSIVIPAAFLLLDAVRDKVDRNYVRTYWRSYAIVGFALALGLIARFSVVHGLGPAKVDPALEVTHGAMQRIMTALQVWPDAARLLFFPRTLLADYDPQILMPLTEWTPRAAIGLALFVATFAGGLVALASKQRVWALGLLWYAITILVVSNLIIPIGVLLAERTLYLPSFSVAVAVAALIGHARMPKSRNVGWVFALVCVLLAARTITRIPVWRSTDTVMLSIAETQPNSFRAQWHIARMQRDRGNAKQALLRYDRALKLWPYREALVEEAAQYATANGRAPWARDVAFFGTVRWPQNVGFYRMLAANAVDLGDSATARKAVIKGLVVSPKDPVLNQMSQAFVKRRTP